jgi:uridine kinase
MQEWIVKRDGRVVPFKREKITTAVYSAAVAVGGRNRGQAERVTDDVLAMLDARSHTETYPSVEEVQDLVEKALIERGHARTAKAYILYRYEHALKRAGRESLTYSSENIPYRKLWEALDWATDHGCVTLEELGRAVAPGRLEEFITECEAFADCEISAAVERILEKKESLRMVIVAGPSSSGKSTTTARVKEKLAESGVLTVPLTVDNYFFDLTVHPTVGEDRDFETPHALDLALINAHLRTLLDGGRVEVPFYNFRTGRREGASGEARLGRGEVLLIDSLHGLYPAMTEGIPEEAKFRLYVETLSALKDAGRRHVRWADIRLLRRMVRDRQFRSYAPGQTIRHWHLVRRAELRYIVPEARRAHAIVNSFLPYELAVMKGRVGGLLPALLAELEASPERDDARERAARVIRLFDEIPAITDEAVPRRSLLREFIGGGINGQRG